MRLAGKQKLGYFPLPLAEAERIRRFLKFPISGCATLAPCIGDGGAFHAIAGDPQAIRYGTELDAYRVEQRFAPFAESSWEEAVKTNPALKTPNRYNIRKDGLTPEQLEAGGSESAYPRTRSADSPLPVRRR